MADVQSEACIVILLPLGVVTCVLPEKLRLCTSTWSLAQVGHLDGQQLFFAVKRNVHFDFAISWSKPQRVYQQIRQDLLQLRLGRVNHKVSIFGHRQKEA